MRLDTFKSKARSYRKLEIIRGILFFLAMGTAAAITLLVARRVDTVGFDSTAIIIVLSSYTAIAALMFYILCPLQQKQVRKLEGGCPGCGKMLLTKCASSVVGTGKCPSCGIQVIHSNPETTPRC